MSNGEEVIIMPEGDLLFRPAPIGKRRLKSNGHGCTYWVVKVAHPDVWAYKHRAGAEKKIGRQLMSDECVHHIDGDHLNNGPDNLAVWTRQEHALHHYHLDDCYFPYGA